MNKVTDPGQDRGVAVIVVTYNGMRNEWIRHCLDSLQDAGLIASTIIIDNASTDATYDYARGNYTVFHCSRMPANAGFGKGNNAGLRIAYEAGFAGMFLLNQDATVNRDTVPRLVRAGAENPEFGILSPLHLNGSGELLDYKFLNYISNSYDEGRRLYSDAVLGRPLDRIYEVQYVNAASWLVSRNCVKKVGLFNPLFEQYGEDDNYAQRVRYHGFRIGVVPGSDIRHDREERMGARKQKTSDEKLDRDYNLFLTRALDINRGEYVGDYLAHLYKTTLKSALMFRLAELRHSATMIRRVNAARQQIRDLRERDRTPHAWMGSADRELVPPADPALHATSTGL